MQSFSLSATCILVLAFFAAQCKQNPTNQAITPVETQAPTAVGHRIAYVNIDTLYEKYTWFKTQKAEIEKSVTDAQNSARAKEESFMKRVQAFQERAQSGNVPPVELEREQSKLAAEEQELQRQQAKLANSLEEKSRNANEQLLATLETKLKEIQSQIGYDYILGYQRGNPTILLANEKLDVTNQVLELLNAQGPSK